MFQKVGEPFWNNGAVHIIGGGPSLIGFDFKSLKGKGYSIGINDSAFKLNTDALFSLDTAWMCRRVQRIMDFQGEKFLAVPNNYDFERNGIPGVHYLRHQSYEGLNFDNAVVNGSNSGFGAINLTFHKHVKRIILFGFDMQAGKKRSHWHRGYTWYNQDTETKKYPKWIREFEKASIQLIQSDITCLNANDNSLLDCFVKISPEAFYAWE